MCAMLIYTYTSFNSSSRTKVTGQAQTIQAKFTCKSCELYCLCMLYEKKHVSLSRLVVVKQAPLMCILNTLMTPMLIPNLVKRVMGK